MKKIKLFGYIILSLLLLPSCHKREPIDDLENFEYVNDWIFETMNIYYYWSDKIPKNPDQSQKPDLFFNSILNKFNAQSNPDGDRFSWIEEDYVSLLNSLSGISADEIGFEFVRIGIEDTNPQQYYLWVIYPKKGTDAAAKGIKRGQFVTKINNNTITDDNYNSLVKAKGTRKLTIGEWVEKGSKMVLEETKVIEVNTYSNYAEHPLYLDSVYTLKNGKKVGYLVYNFFATDKGDKSRTYDFDLLKAIERIDATGNVREIVVDLRYNGGGAISSAIALGSALVPNRNTKELFSYVEYNPIVHAANNRKYGDDFNKDFFVDEILVNNNPTPIPNTNFDKIYFLVSRWTASASEMVINSLLPYLNKNIILIGETTVGKNVGSVSFYEEDDPKNRWGMQPIIAKFFNKDGKSDFTAGFVPDYAVSEITKDLFLYEFGDTDDLMLNKALSLANGGAILQKSPRKDFVENFKFFIDDSKNGISINQKMGRTTLNDDIRGKEIRNLNK